MSSPAKWPAMVRFSEKTPIIEGKKVKGTSLAWIGAGQYARICIHIPDGAPTPVQKTNGYVLAFFVILGVGLLVTGASTIGKLGELKLMNEGARVILATTTIVAGCVVLFITWVKRNKPTLRNEAEEIYKHLLDTHRVNDFRGHPHMQYLSYLADNKGRNEKLHHVRWHDRIIVAITPEELDRLRQFEDDAKKNIVTEYRGPFYENDKLVTLYKGKIIPHDQAVALQKAELEAKNKRNAQQQQPQPVPQPQPQPQPTPQPKQLQPQPLTPQPQQQQLAAQQQQQLAAQQQQQLAAQQQQQLAAQQQQQLAAQQQQQLAAQQRQQQELENQRIQFQQHLKKSEAFEKAALITQQNRTVPQPQQAPQPAFPTGPCPEGPSCALRGDLDHSFRYSHIQADTNIPTVEKTVKAVKPLCKALQKGLNCRFLADQHHLNMFDHPTGNAPSQATPQNQGPPTMPPTNASTQIRNNQEVFV